MTWNINEPQTGSWTVEDPSPAFAFGVPSQWFVEANLETPLIRTFIPGAGIPGTGLPGSYQYIRIGPSRWFVEGQSQAAWEVTE